MENTVKVEDRVLARVTAADLSEVVGGIGGPYNNTCTVTGSPTGNLNGSDITNTDSDCD
jgi:hypothetical protein